MTRDIEIVYAVNMAKEDGRSFREVGERGRAVLKRVAIPAIQATALMGVAVGMGDVILNPGNGRKIDDEVNTRVSQVYPRKVSEEEYDLAQREIVSFRNDFLTSPHLFIDRNTLSIKIPEKLAHNADMIAQEDTRSRDASVLKSQLKDQYEVDEGGTKRGWLIVGLSLLANVLPNKVKSVVSAYRRYRKASITQNSANS